MFVADDPEYQAMNELVRFKTTLSSGLESGMRVKQESTQHFLADYTLVQSICG